MLPVDCPFDYTYLTHWYTDQGYKYPRNKIAAEIKKGRLVQLKRGL